MTAPAGVFWPRLSLTGWFFNIAFPLAVALPAVFIGMKHALKNPGVRIVLVPVIGFVVVALFFASIYPTMKYIVRNGTIYLCCGPFRWQIPIKSVRSIVEKDLEYLPWSEGWKLPGYTLFRIRYGGIGTVRMCATAMTKRILLIQTDSDVWGITPEDTMSFVDAVASEGSK